MTVLKRKWVWLAAGFMAIAAAVMAEGLTDFDLGAHHTRDLSFSVDDTIRTGTLVVPANRPSPPVALIVHGDGPQDRFSSDGYLPLINALLDAGIGVFTWDKAGIGGSTGSWLDQSMADRAKETLAAYQMVKALPDISTDQIGFLGFSQAGWVVPQVASNVTPAFSVLIGAAVNWQRQGDYYMSVRLRNEGMDLNAIKAEIAASAIRDDALFAADAPVPDGFDPASFGFIQRNRLADAASDIADMQGPVLALWGAQDLNVDPATNAADYDRLLPNPAIQQTAIVPNASHSLLRDGRFNTQLVTDWSVPTQALFIMMGRKAYAPDALEHITTWIHSHLPSGAHSIK